MSNRTGISDGSGTQTLIYRNETVQKIADTAFGYVGQDRQTLRYQLRPVGYTSAADFYVYNSHYKASKDSSAPGPNATKRLNEADAIRLDSDALGDGTHAIYAGDHNFYYSDAQEPAWGRPFNPVPARPTTRQIKSATGTTTQASLQSTRSHLV